MDLTKIVSISGKPGLYKVSGQSKNSVIVESLNDGRRFPAFSHDKMSSLEEISIFTSDGDSPLKNVFANINDEFGAVLDFDPKKMSNDQIRSKFELVLPDYERENVYVSDMKKVFVWYAMLQEKNLLDFSEEQPAANMDDSPVTEQVSDSVETND